MKRGDIFWCDLNPRLGHEQGEIRPVIFVSVDAYNDSRSPMVGIVPLTRAAPKTHLSSDRSQADCGLWARPGRRIDAAW